MPGDELSEFVPGIFAPCSDDLHRRHNNARCTETTLDRCLIHESLLEPGSAFRVLREYLYKTYGEKANERIIAAGSRNSLLETICKEQGYSFVEFPQTVGGRYTAVTAV